MEAMHVSPFSILVIKENPPLNPSLHTSDLIEPDIPFYAPGNDPRRLLQREAAIAAEELFKRAQKRKSIYGEFPVIAPIKGRKNCSLLQMDAPVLLRLDAVSIRPVLPLISPAQMKTMN